MKDHADFKHAFKIDDVKLEPPATTNGLTKGPPASIVQIKEGSPKNDEYYLKPKQKVDWDDGTKDIRLDKIDPPDEFGNYFVTRNSITVAPGTNHEFSGHALIGEDTGTDDGSAQHCYCRGVHRIKITVVPDEIGGEPGGSARGGRD